LRNRQLLSFEYENVSLVIEPYTLGLSIMGEDVLRGYQVERGDMSSNTIGWQIFMLHKINNIKLIDKKFLLNQDGYDIQDDKIVVSYLAVSSNKIYL
ncbi:MAG: hypothetical protein K0U47_01945, partial [Epsilonproteobacteria bacterium]|nr:hypothetical protein [Campylobacterota bacterium]